MFFCWRSLINPIILKPQEAVRRQIKLCVKITDLRVVHAYKSVIDMVVEIAGINIAYFERALFWQDELHSIASVRVYQFNALISPEYFRRYAYTNPRHAVYLPCGDFSFKQYAL